MPPAAQHPLWQRLQSYRVDDPDASLTFTRRLARENGWSIGFAARVVEEYKRFVFLAMTAGHEVTPSDEVDQAWHLHLTYTRSYWGELCEEVLDRPLHHGPTKGGKAEGNRFEDQYERTLTSYRAAFGEVPPEDIWPPATIRFGEAASFVRVNKSRAWVLPKPWRIDRGRPAVLAACLIGLAPPLAAGATWNPLDFNGPQFLTFYACLGVFAVIASLVCRFALRAPDDRSADNMPLENPETVAALRGGWQQVFHAAMAGLISEGAISIEKQKGILSSGFKASAERDPTPEDSDLRSRILVTAGRQGVTVSELGKACRSEAEKPVENLQTHGLLETAEGFRPVTTAVALLMGSTLLLGVAKLVVGLGRDKPVGFLVFGLIVLLVIGLFLIRMPTRTRAGERRLMRLRVDGTTLKQRAKDRNASLDPSDMALAVALYGVAACPHPGLDPLRQAVAATSADSGGCGGGGDSGCGGGGGCGGGCGGCGG